MPCHKAAHSPVRMTSGSDPDLSFTEDLRRSGRIGAAP